MRFAIPLSFAAGIALLAGCVASSPPQQVNATVPSISYRVTDNNTAQADAQARAYCQQYGQVSVLQSVQTDSAGRVANYTCGSTAAAVPPAYVAQPAYAGSSTAPAVVVQCADAYHQDRPGGADYHGPYVAGCPRTY